MEKNYINQTILHIQFKFSTSLLDWVLEFIVLMFSNTIINVIFITELTETSCLSGAVPYNALKIVRRPKEEVRVEACS